jgi:acetyl esterase/lipase
MGTSSGGHLAVLAGLKPFDPRYAGVPLPGGEQFDARVSCIVAMWPVICPLTRYRENLTRGTSGDSYYAERVGGGLDQMKYWLTEEAMGEGSPMLALERGDKVDTPDVLYVQALCDIIHPRHCMDRFCEHYRRRGGRVETVLVEGEPYDLVRTKAQSAEARRAVKRATDFIIEHSLPATRSRRA